MKKVAFFTLGCKVNQYDTAAMADLFTKNGFEEVDFQEKADVYVVNTCTVTQMSDKKSRQMIARAHTKNPEAKIIVTGCYAQRAPQEVLSLPGVMVVSGTKRHEEVLKAAREETVNKQNLVTKHEKKAGFEAAVGTKENRTRAHIKIQDGCDRYCTYCIIPYTRGPVVSRTPDSILEELQRLAKEGFQEVVITGIHVMSYGKDLPDKPTLIDVIRLCEGVEGIKRVRFSSLEPYGFSDALLQAIANSPKVCDHFHLSLQSGSNTVLKRMNRRYTKEEYYDCVQRIRSLMKDAAITTDIILGFPGETEEEFLETMDFVKQVGFARVHAFPYSKRSGTAAAGFEGQIPHSVKHERTKQLIALSKELEEQFLSRMTGSVQEVLAEEENEEGYLEGYTRNYARTVIKEENRALSPSQTYKVLIKEVTNEKLIGELME